MSLIAVPHDNRTNDELFMAAVMTALVLEILLVLLLDAKAKAKAKAKTRTTDL